MILILLFIVGIFFGSFLNVLVDRLARDESVIYGRSYCESCRHTLSAWDLLPLISFLLLRGRCRYCHVSLSLYYPLVELMTGVLFVITGVMYGNSLAVLLYSLFIVSSLIVVFFTDLKYGIILDVIIFPATAVALLFTLFTHPSALPTHLLSAIGSCAFFFFLFFITKGKGMGFGDVKFAFFLGLFLGFPNIIIALYIAFIVGAIVSLLFIGLRKKKFHGGTISFGPFLVFGALVSFYYGTELLQYIWRGL